VEKEVIVFVDYCSLYDS